MYKTMTLAVAVSMLLAGAPVAARAEGPALMAPTTVEDVTVPWSQDQSQVMPEPSPPTDDSMWTKIDSITSRNQYQCIKVRNDTVFCAFQANYVHRRNRTTGAMIDSFATIAGSSVIAICPFGDSIAISRLSSPERCEVYTRTGTYVRTFYPSGGQQVRGLEWDGSKFWASTYSGGLVIYTMTPGGTVLRSLTRSGGVITPSIARDIALDRMFANRLWSIPSTSAPHKVMYCSFDTSANTWTALDTFRTGLTGYMSGLGWHYDPAVGGCIYASTFAGYYIWRFKVHDIISPNDVGCTHIVAPAGNVDSGTAVTPACSVYNFGTASQSYTVRMRIGSGYNQTASISGHSPGTRRYLTFATWTANARGYVATACSTELTGDGYSGNDKRRDSVLVNVTDVGCTRILAPAGNVDSAATVAPACSVYNFGTTTPASYTVRLKVGAYDQPATVTSHAPGTRRYVTFPNWTANVPRGSNAVSCSTELSTDVYPANDKATGTVNVNIDDVGATHIVVPSGNVDSGSVITPACSVYNFGTTTLASYTVRMRVGAVNQTATVSGHAAGTRLYVTFANWTVNLPRGSYTASCSTQLATDRYRSNDVTTGPYQVVVSDVGATAIVAPNGNVPVGTSVAPSARVKNFGSLPATFDVRFVIDNGADVPVYDTTETGITVAAGESLEQTFTKTWTASPAGSYTTKAWTILAGDVRAVNDTARGTCTVVAAVAGWQIRKWMPDLASGKQMKDGGWLAEAGDLIYGAKGNKTGDFYSYDPVGDTWHPLALIPNGIEGKPPSKGACGVAGGDYIYATKGNNTQGFWGYNVALDSWKQLANVPLGLSNKKVKGGTDMIYVHVQHDTGYVYLLKGYKNEFFRYNCLLDSWQSLPDAPATLSPKYDKGSWLVGKKMPGPPPKPYALYAHQAKYHGFYAYDTDSAKWRAGALKGMPFISRTGKSKKSKDGGCAASDGDAIYAFKGGNTQEFWGYDIVGDSWHELDTIPAMAPGGTKKKKVKAGADMVMAGDYLYASKGNKSNEFWRYMPVWPPLYADARPGRSGVMASALGRPVSGLSISPNPLATGFATLRFGLPRAGAVAVGIFDVTGRRVFESNLVVGRSGATSLDLRHLSAGVYLVKLSSGDFSSSQKLVIER